MQTHGFLVHGTCEAQGVLTVAALYERRIIFTARSRRSQTAATTIRARNLPRGDKRGADRPATAPASSDRPDRCFGPASSAEERFRFRHYAKSREGPRIA